MVFFLAKKMQPEKSVCVCNSHFWYTYISKDCGNIVSHLRDLSSVFFFSQGHFCCSSGNCNTFRFNEPGFLPSECILRCSNLATEQWFPRGWNGKGRAPKNQGSKIHVHPLIWGAKWRFQNLQKSVPRYSTSGAEDEQFCFQDDFNPFYASRFSTFLTLLFLLSRAMVLSRSLSFFGCFGRGMDPQCAYATTYATGYCILASCTVHRKCPLVRFLSFEFFCRFFPPDLRYEFYIYMRFVFLDSFFEKVHNQSSLTATRLILEKPPKTGSWNGTYFGEITQSKAYSKFEGFPPKHVQRPRKLTWQWETNHEWVDASPSWKLGDVPFSHVAFQRSWLVNLAIPNVPLPQIRPYEGDVMTKTSVAKVNTPRTVKPWPKRGIARHKSSVWLPHHAGGAVVGVVVADVPLEG